MANLRKIRLDLELDEPTGVYTVTSPDVPGLVTEGGDLQEVLDNVKEAVELLLESHSELAKGDSHWDERLAKSQDALTSLADEALVEFRQGKTQELDPDKL